MDDNGKHLTAGLRRGKEEAFAYVFRLYYGPLLNYAGRILKDTELANDVVQECFCKLYERRKELKEELEVRPYLYKSVYNSCMDAIKHQKVRDNYINQELLDFYFSKVIETPEAEQALLEEDLRGAIQDAIDKLPERCREIFVLSCVEGLKYQEVADKLGVTINTVKTQVRFGYKKVRSDLNLPGTTLFMLLSMLLK